MAIQLKNSPWERIASQAKIQPAAKEIGKLPWQCGEPVAVEPQVLQVSELADLGRQGGELVAAEQQPAEVGELGDLGRQGGELVAVERQVLQVSELAYLGGSAVSWLWWSLSVRRLVSWPISGGSAGELVAAERQ